MEKMKVAVIGCGTIANSAHIPSYLKNENVEIKYFCDIIPERADAAVAKYGCGKAVYDYHEILDDPEVEAVSVCTPNYAHAPISIDFLKAGKNVLCEKPAARTYQEALTMLEAQHETGKVLNIGVVNRFNDGVNKIKELIDQGELGEVYQVYVSFRSHRSIPGLGGAFTTKSIAGGGVLIDWGVHFLDIVMYCCGDPKPLTATAETFSRLGKDMPNYNYVSMWAGPPKLDGEYSVEEGITGMVRTDGPVITLNGAWAQNLDHDEMYIDFLGDKGGARLTYGEKFEFFTTRDGFLQKVEPKYEIRRHYEVENEGFFESIRTGEKGRAYITNILESQRVLDAIYASAEKKEEIRL